MDFSNSQVSAELTKQTSVPTKQCGEPTQHSAGEGLSFRSTSQGARSFRLSMLNNRNSLKNQFDYASLIDRRASYKTIDPSVDQVEVAKECNRSKD